MRVPYARRRRRRRCRRIPVQSLFLLLRQTSAARNHHHPMCAQLARCDKSWLWRTRSVGGNVTVEAGVGGGGGGDGGQRRERVGLSASVATQQGLVGRGGRLVLEAGSGSNSGGGDVVVRSGSSLADTGSMLLTTPPAALRPVLPVPSRSRPAAQEASTKNPRCLGPDHR